MKDQHITSKKTIILALLLSGGAGFSLLVASHSYSVNGSFGFPLDDPWIHLQFAQNLVEYGSFSYFRDEMVTAGSTSPLYTFLLAAGFLFTSNEMILCYALGALFLVLAGYFFFRLAYVVLGANALVAFAAVLLVMSEPRLQWATLSGMETTLFVFLLVFVTYAYLSRKPMMFGIGGGLLVWARPEAILFYVVLALDVFYRQRLARPMGSGKKRITRTPSDHAWLKQPLLIIAILVIAYFALNIGLSGSPFPNTFAAKTKYYSGGSDNFPGEVFHFLADGHMIVLAFFVGVAIISIFIRFQRRDSQPLLIPFLWSLGLFVAYWKYLPFLYQQGRYLMPLLPFVILLGLGGLLTSLDFLKKRISVFQNKSVALASIVFALTVVSVQFALGAWTMRTDYAQYCKYITDRQVQAARWIQDKLPQEVVLATHDIGAIGFYSGRRIVDMVGLVSPEMIDNIGRLDKLQQALVRNRVTHIAVLRNWFEVVNQGPVFQTDPRNPEIMEVFEFRPGRTHLTPQNVTRMADAAEYLIAVGDHQTAGSLLEESLRIDPRSSRLRQLLGKVFLAFGRLDDADRELRSAVELYPDYWEAQVALAEVAARRNKPEEAIASLEGIVQRNPGFAPGYRALADIYASFGIDSVRAESMRHRYNELVQRGMK